MPTGYTKTHPKTMKQRYNIVINLKKGQMAIHTDIK